MNVQVILVPQGAEHRAVCRGLRRVSDPPAVFSIPVGVSLAQRLQQLARAGCLYRKQFVLVMGLCGGLKPDLAIGSIVLYQSCLTKLNEHSCDRALTEQIHKRLPTARLVKAITSDRVISRAAEKQQLAERGADVVDMEGSITLTALADLGVSVAMLRVLSDDCQTDIPDLTHVFTADGSLQPIALTLALLKQPIAAMRLIRGSTRSLKILQNLTFELFNN